MNLTSTILQPSTSVTGRRNSISQPAQSLERYRLRKMTALTKKRKEMNEEINPYNDQLTETDKAICNLLAMTIDKELTEAESKIWHAHPVWFLNNNPTVGYSKQKRGIRLMFWSGADFDEKSLIVKGQKFKDASIFYNSVEEVNTNDLIRWLKKSKEIQWDYKNLIKRKGKLERLK